jgi:hypothetical protein
MLGETEVPDGIEMDVPHGTNDSVETTDSVLQWRGNAVATLMQGAWPKGHFKWQRSLDLLQTLQQISKSSMAVDIVGGGLPGSLSARAILYVKSFKTVGWLKQATHFINGTPTDKYLASDNVGSYGQKGTASIHTDRVADSKTCTLAVVVSNPPHEQPTFAMLLPESNPLTWPEAKSLPYTYVMLRPNHWDILNSELLGQAKKCFSNNNPVDRDFIAQMGDQAIGDSVGQDYLKKMCPYCQWWTNATSTRICEVCKDPLPGMDAQRSMRALNDSLCSGGTQPVKVRRADPLTSATRMEPRDPPAAAVVSPSSSAAAGYGTDVAGPASNSSSSPKVLFFIAHQS